MANTLNWLCVILLLTLSMRATAKDIEFGGYTWTVRSGQGGPGPNSWLENNVWLDSETNLHLKIALRDGKWSCAEVTMHKRLGLGRYQFKTRGRLDQLDDNVVLGLFNYPTGEIGPDGTHEIDIEFARWGESRNPIGNFTVWPVEKGLQQVTKSFEFNQGGDRSMHRFLWKPDQILFQTWRGHRDEDGQELSRWLFKPQDAAKRLSQKPMPVHLNLWLFKGLPPKDGKEVEVVIQEFSFKTE
jgi:hypothetical protein